MIMSEIDLIQDLACTNLTQLPKNVLSMTNLKMLYLEGNQLEELPCELFLLLNKLCWLDLRNNKLKSIPTSIMNHPSLETFLLQNNNIEKLPMELGFLPNIKVLQLARNPLVYPQKSIIAEGINSILEYLRKDYLTASNKVEKDDSYQDYNDEISQILNKNPRIVSSPASTSSKNQLQMPVVSYKPLKVSLTKKEKKIRKLQKSASKYKDTSYSNSSKYLYMQPRKRNEIRIQEQYMKELWMKKLKDVMSKQEELLQKEKDLETIRRWRYKMKHKFPKNNSEYKLEVPYDYDLEYDKIPSRLDLEKDIKPPSIRRVASKKINVEKLITDIIESLKSMERERSSHKSPQTQMDYAGRDIKRILDLQKRLSTIKLTNEKNLI